MRLRTDASSTPPDDHGSVQVVLDLLAPDDAARRPPVTRVSAGAWGAAAGLVVALAIGVGAALTAMPTGRTTTAPPPVTSTPVQPVAPFSATVPTMPITQVPPQVGPAT